MTNTVNDIHILHLEDEEQVVEMVKTLLAAEGFAARLTVAADKAQFRKALAKCHYDLILADYQLPDFNGLEALHMVREQCPEVPFLLFSGQIGEELAIDFIKKGAIDYVLKSRINRLIPAIRRALEEAEEHRKLKRAQQELKEAYEAKEQLLSSIRSVLIGIDENDRITIWNRAAEETFGFPARQVMGSPFLNSGIRWNWKLVLEKIGESQYKKQTVTYQDVRYTRPDGSPGFLNITVNPINGPDDKTRGYLLLMDEVTERKNLESQLLQSQKLEAIGQLAAGIAHEINTPIQFIADNLHFLLDANGQIWPLLEAYESLEAHCGNPAVLEQKLAEIAALRDEIEIDYLKEEIPQALQQSLEGARRVAEIVRAMKDFSHPGNGEKVLIDINKTLRDTITVSRNEWKYVAELETDFDPDLPPVPCLPGEINQVFLNIIVNAAQAIEDARGKSPDQKGKIRISTGRQQDRVEVRISDTGTGMTAEVQKHIFDPFFTTKEIGRGTGQGLSIARNIIVEKHGGEIFCESRPGEGTTFIIRLPVNGS